MVWFGPPLPRIVCDRVGWVPKATRIRSERGNVSVLSHTPIIDTYHTALLNTYTHKYNTLVPTDLFWFGWKHTWCGVVCDRHRPIRKGRRGNPKSRVFVGGERREPTFVDAVSTGSSLVVASRVCVCVYGSNNWLRTAVPPLSDVVVVPGKPPKCRERHVLHDGVSRYATTRTTIPIPLRSNHLAVRQWIIPTPTTTTTLGDESVPGRPRDGDHHHPSSSSITTRRGNVDGRKPSVPRRIPIPSEPLPTITTTTKPRGLPSSSFDNVPWSPRPMERGTPRTVPPIPVCHTT